MKKLAARWADLYESILAPQVLPLSAQRLLLGLILIVTLSLRLWTMDTPYLDRAGWKEIDHLSISTNYWQHGFDFFRPEVSWPAEPPRVTELELPLVPYLTAIFYALFGYSAYSARLMTLLASLLLVVYVFRLGKRELGPVVGLVASAAAATMAFYHPFGRILFSEPWVLALSVVALFHWAQWIDRGRRGDWLVALVSFSLVVSLKLTALYLLLPLAWLTFRRHRWQVRAYRPFVLMVGVALVLPALWYSYAYYLETIGVRAFGIFRGHDKMQPLTYLLRLGWYRLMAERIAGDVLGGEFGTLFALIGVLAAIRQRRGGLFFAYLLAIGAFFGIVAEGNLDTPYRQMPAIPPLSIFVALGALALVSGLVAAWDTMRSVRFTLRLAAAMSVLALAGLLLAHPLRHHEPVTQWLEDPARPAGRRWEFAQAVQGYLDADSKVVALGEYSVHVGGNDSSPSLFYYLQVQGWNLQPEDWSLATIEQLVGRGATHLTALPTYGEPESAPFLQHEDGERFVNELKARYCVLYKNDNELLLDLQQPATC